MKFINYFVCIYFLLLNQIYFTSCFQIKLSSEDLNEVIEDTIPLFKEFVSKYTIPNFSKEINILITTVKTDINKIRIKKMNFIPQRVIKFLSNSILIIFQDINLTFLADFDIKGGIFNFFGNANIRFLQSSLKIQINRKINSEKDINVELIFSDVKFDFSGSISAIIMDFIINNIKNFLLNQLKNKLETILTNEIYEIYSNKVKKYCFSFQLLKNHKENKYCYSGLNIEDNILNIVMNKQKEKKIPIYNQYHSDL